jgi:hypothetical protein
LQLVNSTLAGPYLFIGTRDFDGSFYHAGLSDNSCLFTIPRDTGWHKLEINIGSSSAELYIDAVLVGSCAGDFGFDRIQLSLSGVMYSPLPTFYFDDFNFEPFEAQAIPTLTEWGLIIFSVLLMTTIVWYLRKRKLAPASISIFLLVFAISFYFSSII